MPKQHNTYGLQTCLFAVAALISGLVSDAGHGWAKHHKTQNQPAASSDPCAAPTAFIEAQITKIRGLQPPKDAGTANNVAAWIFESEGAKKSVDQDKIAQISELRHDADSVNDMLRAGGCKAVDIDQQLGNAGTKSHEKK
jgi:hypothetical protein